MNVVVDNNNKQNKNNTTKQHQQARTGLICFSAPLIELFVCLFLAYG